MDTVETPLTSSILGASPKFSSIVYYYYVELMYTAFFFLQKIVLVSTQSVFLVLANQRLYFLSVYGARCGPSIPFNLKSAEAIPLDFSDEYL